MASAVMRSSFAHIGAEVIHTYSFAPVRVLTSLETFRASKRRAVLLGAPASIADRRYGPAGQVRWIRERVLRAPSAMGPKAGAQSAARGSIPNATLLCAVHFKAETVFSKPRRCLA